MLNVKTMAIRSFVETVLFPMTFIPREGSVYSKCIGILTGINGKQEHVKISPSSGDCGIYYSVTTPNIKLRHAIAEFNHQADYSYGIPDSIKSCTDKGDEEGAKWWKAQLDMKLRSMERAKKTIMKELSM